MPRAGRLRFSALLLAGASGLALAAGGDWFHALERLQWQARDVERAAARVSGTTALTAATGRPRGLSALRGDVAVLTRNLDRLERRFAELEALPIAEGSLRSASEVGTDRGSR